MDTLCTVDSNCVSLASGVHGPSHAFATATFHRASGSGITDRIVARPALARAHRVQAYAHPHGFVNTHQTVSWAGNRWSRIWTRQFRARPALCRARAPSAFTSRPAASRVARRWHDLDCWSPWRADTGRSSHRMQSSWRRQGPPRRSGRRGRSFSKNYARAPVTGGPSRSFSHLADQASMQSSPAARVGGMLASR
jgi:hypothetical protein